MSQISPRSPRTSFLSVRFYTDGPSAPSCSQGRGSARGSRAGLSSSSWPPAHEIPPPCELWVWIPAVQRELGNGKVAEIAVVRCEATAQRGGHLCSFEDARRFT